ncbi:MAG: hypothetical protein JJT94_05110 [Bernardetiaceae bacterium]|nr:hypothetical protein [Bernardetiaceae bacterium]
MLVLSLLVWSFFVLINSVGSDTWRFIAASTGFMGFLGLTFVYVRRFMSVLKK